MGTNFLRTALSVAGLAAGLSLGGAQAAMGPQPAESLSMGGAATPVAMCGYTCRNGGRYIPGPPSVCREEGLEYCGSSRDWGDQSRGRRMYRDDDESEVIIERRGYGRY